MTKFLTTTATIALLALTSVGAIAQTQEQVNPEPKPEVASPMTDGVPAPLQSIVKMKNNEGMDVGTVTLTQMENGVMMTVNGENLPEGTLGFHVHEKGECTPTESFTNAGGHFNPHTSAHGFNHADGAHAGDMPNLNVGADGTVKTEIFNDAISLNEGDDAYLLDTDGSSLVIHVQADDYITQTSGDAGARIACGIIE